MSSDGDRERLEIALEAGCLDLWETDLTTGELVRKTSKVFRELGYTAPGPVESLAEVFNLIHPEDVPRVKRAIDEHLAGQTERYISDYRILANDGQWVWYSNYGKLVQIGNDPADQRFVGVTFNIDDKKRTERELEMLNRKLGEQNAKLKEMNAILQSLASTDSLTGVANRRCLLEAGEREFRRSRRFDHRLSLLILDIDHFKSINDTWGHGAGDRVICEIADTCSRHVRSDLDVVGRLGGEEFAVVLPQTTHAGALELAARLKRAIADLRVTVESSAIAATVSIGVATSSRDCDLFTDLLAQADRRLYAAKTAGRNCVQGENPQR